MQNRRPPGSSNPKNSGKPSFKKRSFTSNREEGRKKRSFTSDREEGRDKDSKRGFDQEKRFRRDDNRSERPPQNKKDNRGAIPQKGKSKVGVKPRVMVASSWSAKGEAVVNNPDGKRTLIWSGIPFEKAVVQVTHAGQHQSYGYVKSIDVKSPSRVEPKCKRYDRCGGCPFMHLNTEGQDDAKLQLFAQAMETAEDSRVVEYEKSLESGAFTPALEPLTPVTWPNKLIRVGTDKGYRMVSKLVAGRAKHGALRLGARNRNGSIVPIPDCVVTDSDLNVVGKNIAYLLDVLKIFPYTPSNQSGVRYVVLRKSRATKQILVTLVVTQRTHFIQELAERIFKLPFTIQGVLIHLNTEKGNAIFVRDENGSVRTSTLIGQREVTERLGGIEYQIGSGDFFQVNIHVAERLQQDVLALSKSYREFPMIDLYCGVGLFTLPLAKEHGWAMGIEMVDGAIRRAKDSAQKQGINVEFISGDVFEQLDAVERKINKASPFIVVDPSRTGLADGVAASLDELNPVAIAYISCHPRSLARDLMVFREMGWTVEDIQLYDMFPNTVHIESLVLLTPPKDRTHQQRQSTPKRHKMTVRTKLKAPTVKPQSKPE